MAEKKHQVIELIHADADEEELRETDPFVCSGSTRRVAAPDEHLYPHQQCKSCGEMFETTNQRLTHYCKGTAPDEMVRAELKPCPFCGETPVFSTMTATPQGVKVRCNFCWTRSGDHKDAEAAANAWNTRVPPEGSATWQPISSAPKDGTRILLAINDNPDVLIGTCFAPPLGSGRWLDDNGDELYHEPTRWMSLPPNDMEGKQDGDFAPAQIHSVDG